MVYLQHRVSPHSYSRDRRWDRCCRQSAHFCLQAPLPQTRPVIMDQSPPDHAPHDTRSRPPSSRRCGPGRSGRHPGQLPPRRLVCIQAATARGPQRGVDADPERLLGWWWQGRQSLHPDRWIVAAAAQLAQCCVRWWGPQYRRLQVGTKLGTTKPPTRVQPNDGAPHTLPQSPGVRAP